MRNILEAAQTVLFYIMASLAIAGCVALYQGMEWVVFFKAWGTVMILIGLCRGSEVILYEL